jgi:hypothetical protein
MNRLALAATLALRYRIRIGVINGSPVVIRAPVSFGINQQHRATPFL